MRHKQSSFQLSMCKNFEFWTSVSAWQIQKADKLWQNSLSSIYSIWFLAMHCVNVLWIMNSDLRAAWVCKMGILWQAEQWCSNVITGSVAFTGKESSGHCFLVCSAYLMSFLSCCLVGICWWKAFFFFFRNSGIALAFNIQNQCHSCDGMRHVFGEDFWIMWTF